VEVGDEDKALRVGVAIFAPKGATSQGANTLVLNVPESKEGLFRQAPLERGRALQKRIWGPSGR